MEKEGELGIPSPFSCAKNSQHPREGGFIIRVRKLRNGFCISVVISCTVNKERYIKEKVKIVKLFVELNSFWGERELFVILFISNCHHFQSFDL